MIGRRSSGAVLVALALLVVGCGSDGPSASEDEDSSVVIVTTTTTTTTVTTVAPATSATPSTQPAVDGTAAPSSDPTSTTPSTTDAAVDTTAPPTTVPPPVVGNPSVAAELVLDAVRPVDLAVRAGDPSLYLVEQRGTVRRVSESGDEAIVFDISDRVSDANEQGLLGLVFSPDAALAYVDFTDAAGTTTIAEYGVAADGTIDGSTERIVLAVDQPYRNHNAGDLAFGPDGMLYITLGDGGSGGDPERRAGDPTSLLGSLLRIDPAPSGDLGYTVPADNPFASGSLDGVAGAPEVWSWGLRNPWKIAFDPVTDELWIADVGQNEYEEINLVTPTDRPAGYAANFGWSAFEGTEPFNDDVSDQNTTFPVATYRHGDDGCSVSGGVPYRGTSIPELDPAYVYSDYCSGKLWALDLEGGRVLTLLEGFDQVTAVRAGPDQELYVLEASGGVHRLVPG